jgi:hypothetical protein
MDTHTPGMIQGKEIHHRFLGHLRWVALGIVVIVVARAPLNGAEVAASAKTNELSLSEGMKAQVDAIKVLLTTASGAARELKVQSKPLMVYGDSKRLIGNSALMTWMDGSQPALFQKVEVNNAGGGLWTFCVSATSPEFLTISWPQASKQFAPIPAVPIVMTNAPEPALKEADLKIQMLELASEVVLIETSEGKSRELRLFPKPILEFKDPANGVISAAIFVHAVRQNPDFLFILRATQTAEKKMQWTFLPVHLTNAELQLKYDGLVLWKDAEQLSTGFFKHWGYFFTHREK